MLAPIMLAEGAYIAATIQRLPEAEGSRSGVAGTGKPLRLLVIGDSSAAGVGVSTVAESLAGQIVNNLAPDNEVTWRLIAQSGLTTRDMLKLLAQQRSEEPPSESFDVAVTALGVNDVIHGRSVRKWIQDQSAVVEMLRTRFGVQQVYLSGLPPISRFPAFPQPLRWYLGNRAKALADSLETWVHTQDDCEFLDMDRPLGTDYMASDGFHPGARVYELWGAEMAKMIQGKNR